jgi:hypothetical protein
MDGTMEDAKPDNALHPLNLALEIFRHRREHHPLGANYAVRLRLGHAEIQDVTALADVLSALEELGYRVVKKSGPPDG